MEISMQQHMEISLKSELMEEEELVWSGSPNPHSKNSVFH
jgi:hypothetical protein